MCRFVLVAFVVCLMLRGGAPAWGAVLDALGQEVALRDAARVICSGPGCLRLVVYLQAQGQVVAVDDMETRRSRFEARPYALANTQFRGMPTFGEFRGQDNPELILTLEPQPQVIFKAYPQMGHDPAELQQKTGIPVIPLQYGNLTDKRETLYATLRTMAAVLGKQQRAEEIVAFFETQIKDLAQRSAGVPEADRPSVFLGGVAFKGPHGFQSTEPAYPPFQFVETDNLAMAPDLSGKQLQHADVAKEQIVAWNPEVLFLDLSTLQMGEGAGGLHELRTDPAYQSLQAVQQGKVYGLLPYNWYTQNFGSILANAWYIGALLYPERFHGVDPAARADEIWTFLVGAPVFEKMDEAFGSLVFRPVPVN